MKQIKDLPYWITKDGTIYNRHKRALSPYVAPDGYVSIKLATATNKRGNFRIHRLLAEAFIPNPHKLDTINHIDHNKLNNDLSNLEWCSRSDNTHKAFVFGASNMKGENHSMVKLTEKQVLAIRASKSTQKILAAEYGVSPSTISMIKSRKRWKHI